MVSNSKTIATIQKLFPDAKITIDPSLNNAKREPDSKKMRDMRRILSTIKRPLPTP